MKKPLGLSMIALMTGLFVMTASMAPSAAAMSKRVEMTISEPLNVAGIAMRDGRYLIRVNDERTMATFYREGDVTQIEATGSDEVARVRVHPRETGVKFHDTELLSEAGILKELHLHGDTAALVIDGPVS